jgi:uncharacterized membrane protein
MTFPLIGADQEFAIWAVLIGLAGFGFWCERFGWGRKYSGVMMLITAAIVLSNLKIIPTAAPAYDAVWNYLVPIAIPLLLFEADLKRIVRESGPTLFAFVIGSAAVVAGVLIGVELLDLGQHEPELAGIFTGTYIGGGLNFAAVAEASGMQEGSMLSAALAADNVVTNLHFLLIIFLPGIAWVAHRFPSQHIANATQLDATTQDSVHKILTLCVATFLPQLVKKLSGHGEAGNVMMFIFLASVGATADIWRLIEVGPVLFVFAMIIVLVHLLVLFVAGRFLHMDLAELAMASAVCIGGPSSAAALASAKGWKDLLIPGVLAGSFGYAIGSFIGVSVVEWLQ